MKRLAVLISNGGTGTNLQAIINAIEQKKINAEIVIVVSDQEDAFGLVRAKNHKVPTTVNKLKENLTALLNGYNVDLIILAGWKQFLTDGVMTKYKNKILNLHPGLVPDLIDGVVKNPDGTNGLWNKKKFTEKALKNYFDNHSTYAGSSIHFLTNEVDFGPVLGRCFEKIHEDDTIDSLYKRLKKKENKLYVSVLKNLCQERKK